METVVENIIGQMKEMGLSQKELAARSALTVETVNRVLNGKTPLTPNTLQKLSDGLGVPLADLDSERIGTLNHTVQGYLQFADEITRITSFRQLLNWVKKYEPLVNDLPKQAKEILKQEKRNATKASKSGDIDINSIDFSNEEAIDASAIETWSFRKAEDVRDGVDIDLGNMCATYPFNLYGHTFTNSEALYICGMFSVNTPKHRDIQLKLIAAKNGYDAKKAIRRKYEEDYGRNDWGEFNVEWMKWVVWQKIKGNEDFRRVLSSIPRNALIIENSTHQKGATASFWGMKNPELEDKRAVMGQYTQYENPDIKKKDLSVKMMQARNRINHLGTWVGVNCMGKILKYLQICLLDGLEPSIDYDLLRSKQIYLFGELLTFGDVV